MLQQFGDTLGVDPGDDLAFSMVLIEPMLWTRFAVHGGRVATSVHVNGPAAGDLVVIATEAAIWEIVGPSPDVRTRRSKSASFASMAIRQRSRGCEP